MAVGTVGLITRPYSTAAIQERAHLHGNQRMVLLIGCGNSSLVIDKLCGEPGEEDTAVVCFHFDFGVSVHL